MKTRRVHSVFLIVVLLSCPAASIACPAGERIKYDKPERYKHYKRVIVAEVLDFTWVENSIWKSSDLTPPYVIGIGGVEAIHGDVPEKTRFEIGPGCGLFVPKVGEKVSLFFEKRRNIIIPMPKKVFENRNRGEKAKSLEESFKDILRNKRKRAKDIANDPKLMMRKGH